MPAQVEIGTTPSQGCEAVGERNEGGGRVGVAAAGAESHSVADLDVGAASVQEAREVGHTHPTACER